MTSNVLDINVERIYKFNNGKSLKAFADISINNLLLIKSIRIVNGKSGLFVSMPQERSKDNKWYDSVKCLREEIREQIASKVLEAYGSEGVN